MWPGTLHITGSQAQGDHILQTQKEDTLPGLLEILQKIPKDAQGYYTLNSSINFLYKCGISYIKKKPPSLYSCTGVSFADSTQRFPSFMLTTILKFIP